jgi:nicotinamidase-related amidase
MPYTAKEVLVQTEKLISAARSVKIPIIFINVIPARLDSNDPTTQQLAQLSMDVAYDDDVYRITKFGHSAFQEADASLTDLLHQLDVTHIVITGVATNIGVLETVRDAIDAGFTVTAVEDAMSGIDASAHVKTVSGELATLAGIVKTDEFVAELNV